MRPLDLMNRSTEDLEAWTRTQDDTQLEQIFDEIWQEIRGADWGVTPHLYPSQLYSGQPRNEQTANALKLARIAAQIADYRRIPKLLGESSLMLGYVMNADEQYKSSLPHYRSGLAQLEQLGEFGRVARLRIGFMAALFKSGNYDEALQ